MPGHGRTEAAGGASERAAFPGRTAVFPDTVGRVAYGIFGVQAPSTDAAASVTARLNALLRRTGGPAVLERMHYRDAQGWHCDLFLGGWLDAAAYRAWAALPEVAAWWRGLPCGPDDAGVWREVMTPHKDYFQYGAGVEEVAGFASLGTVVPSDKFGYWGGYRDRIPASARDKLLTPLDRTPEPVLRETRGRRLAVAIPDNLCFIREGQAWDRAGTAERAVWAERMEPVVDAWIAHLTAHPAETGCLSLRFCREQEVETGADRARQSQVAFLLSLRHIERAARTAHSHLAVKDTLMGIYEAPPFEPTMHIWVEMFILKQGDLQTEYVNCHPETGLLPYFEVRPFG